MFWRTQSMTISPIKLELLEDIRFHWVFKESVNLSKYRSPEEWNAPGKTWYISSEFGYRFSPTHQKTLPHLGLDFAINEGTSVLAAYAGTVEWAKVVKGYGNQLKLKHTVQVGDEIRVFYTTYNHLKEFSDEIIKEANKAPKDKSIINPGDPIGYVGHTDGANNDTVGQHLHFEVYDPNHIFPHFIEGRDFVNPRLFFDHADYLPTTVYGEQESRSGQYVLKENSTDSREGDSRNNTLYGGGGNDTLSGGSGNDILSGDSGKDLYLFNTDQEGIDKIIDSDGGFLKINATQLLGNAKIAGNHSGKLAWQLTYGAEQVSLYRFLEQPEDLSLFKNGQKFAEIKNFFTIPQLVKTPINPKGTTQINASKLADINRFGFQLDNGRTAIIEAIKTIPNLPIPAPDIQSKFNAVDLSVYSPPSAGLKWSIDIPFPQIKTGSLGNTYAEQKALWEYNRLVQNISDATDWGWAFQNTVSQQLGKTSDAFIQDLSLLSQLSEPEVRELLKTTFENQIRTGLKLPDATQVQITLREHDFQYQLFEPSTGKIALVEYDAKGHKTVTLPTGNPNPEWIEQLAPDTIRMPDETGTMTEYYVVPGSTMDSLLNTIGASLSIPADAIRNLQWDGVGFQLIRIDSSINAHDSVLGSISINTGDFLKNINDQIDAFKAFIQSQVQALQSKLGIEKDSIGSEYFQEVLPKIIKDLVGGRSIEDAVRPHTEKFLLEKGIKATRDFLKTYLPGISEVADEQVRQLLNGAFVTFTLSSLLDPQLMGVKDVAQALANKSVEKILNYGLTNYFGDTFSKVQPGSGDARILNPAGAAVYTGLMQLLQGKDLNVALGHAAVSYAVSLIVEETIQMLGTAIGGPIGAIIGALLSTVLVDWLGIGRVEDHSTVSHGVIPKPDGTGDIIIGIRDAGALLRAKNGQDDVIIGTDGEDVMVGGDQQNLLMGHDGNDLMEGRAGDDLLLGGSGDTHIEGGKDHDYIEGNGGNDRLIGEDGNDTLLGGSGQDILFAGNGDDQVSGESGNDIIQGGAGNDIAAGGSGDDTIAGEAGNDTLIGGTGNDAIWGDSGNDWISGGEGADTLVGGEGDNQLEGGTGHDILLGGTGNDTVTGDLGDDTIAGSTGSDLILGGIGDDLIFGGDGDDILGGELGNDVLIGGAGHDLMKGDGGEDILIAGPGIDTLIGGDGNDVYLISASTELTLILDSDGQDAIFLYDTPSADVSVFTIDFNVVMTFQTGAETRMVILQDQLLNKNIETIHFSDNTFIRLDQAILTPEGEWQFELENLVSIQNYVVEPYFQLGRNQSIDITTEWQIQNPHSTWATDNYDRFMIEQSGEDYQEFYNNIQVRSRPTGWFGWGREYYDYYEHSQIGTAGNDRIVGLWEFEITNGLAGHDMIYGQGAGDDLSGGDGQDFLFGNSGDDRINGNDGADKLFGDTGKDTLYGGSGNDALYGDWGNDRVNADDGDDIASGGWGDDQVEGGAGHDILYGNDGNDSLGGGAGHDIVSGGNGSDFLDGGPGNDTLVGGLGEDFFTFTVADGSTDVIHDFNPDEDKLILDVGWVNFNGPEPVYHISSAIEIDPGNPLMLGQTTKIYLEDGGEIVLRNVNPSQLNSRNVIIGGLYSQWNLGYGKYLKGSAASETLTGGNGTDILIGAGGRDQLNGEAGDDLFFFGGDSKEVTINGGDGYDRAWGTDGNDTPEFLRIHTIEEINGLSGNDQINMSQIAPQYEQITLIGGSGNDTLIGTQGNDRIEGEDDADYLLGRAGDDTIDGGQDNDTINGEDGNDILFGQDGQDSIIGGWGADSIFGGSENDYLEGNEGEDHVEGGSGFNHLIGGAGSDTLIGGDETDSTSDPSQKWLSPSDWESRGLPKYSAIRHGQFRAGDFNGDGITDFTKMVNENNTNSADTYYSTGKLFRSGASMRQQDRYSDIGFSGDFNGDGLSDSITIPADVGVGSWQISLDIHLNNGTRLLHGWSQSVQGQFGWDTRFGWGSLTQIFFKEHFGMMAGDFNGDGKTDLARAFKDNGYVSIDTYLSNGSEFQTANPRWVSQSAGFTQDVQWISGDFDGDGDDDVARAFHYDGKAHIEVYKSNRSNFSGWEKWAAQKSDPVTHWVTGDFNHDGKVDMAGIYRVNGKLNIDLYQSTGSKFEIKFRSTYSDGLDPSAQWAAGDFDGDRYDDIARLSVDPNTGETKTRIFSVARGDLLEGGTGNDSLAGGGGDDTLFGKEDSDTLEGGPGNDYLDGGLGNDLYVIRSGTGTDRILDNGDSSNDTILLDFPTRPEQIWFLKEREDLIIVSPEQAQSVRILNQLADVMPYAKIETLLFQDASSQNLSVAPITQGAYWIGTDDDDTLSRSAAVLYAAGAGNDSITADTDMAATVFGGDGHDTLIGGSKNDLLYGNRGEDYLNGGEGSDSVEGGSGWDTLLGGNGSDTLIGGDGQDSLVGQSDHDVLVGNTGSDTLEGSEGNDSLQGGEDEDLYVFARNGFGSDTIIDSDGILMIDGRVIDTPFHDWNQNGIYTTENRQLQSRWEEKDLILSPTFNIYDQIRIRNFQNGRFGILLNKAPIPKDMDISIKEGETIRLTPADLAVDSDGDGLKIERINGLVDNWVTVSTAENSIVIQAMQEINNRHLDGFWYVLSDAHGARVQGKISLTIEGVNDIPIAKDQFLEMNLGESKRINMVKDASDVDGDLLVINKIIQGPKNGNITWNAESITYTNDRWIGRDEVIIEISDQRGGTIEEKLTIDVKLNTITGNDLANHLEGSPAYDLIQGWGGEDSVYGAEGNDTLEGGAGNDFLDGGYGDDLQIGGDGDDWLMGSDGADTIDGGEGFDLLDYSKSPNSLFINLGNHNIGGGYASGDIFSGIDGVIGTDHSDRLYVEYDWQWAGGAYVDGRGGSNQIWGYRRNDTLLGGKEDDFIDAGEGNDTLVASDGNDSLYGGTGNDTIEGSGFGDKYLDGGEGNDSVTGGWQNDTIYGGEGDDFITSSSGSDLIYTGNGNDTVYGSTTDDVLDARGTTGNKYLNGGRDNDTIYGGLGNDSLVGDNPGEAGNDSISGGEGNDSIDGGEGNDTLIGGTGSDTLWGSYNRGDIGDSDEFWLDLALPGQDIIADFNPATDRIVIENAPGVRNGEELIAAARFESLSYWSGQSYTHLKVKIGNASFILENSTLASLRPEAFQIMSSSTIPLLSGMGITLNGSREVEITYQGGSAGYHNSIGYYRISENGEIHDVQFLFTDQHAITLGGKIDLGTLTAGDTLGFFIIANGYHNLFINSDGQALPVNSFSPDASDRYDLAGGRLEFLAGPESGVPILHYTDANGNVYAYSGHVYHASHALISANPDRTQHALMNLDSNGTGVTIGFEDLYGGGDQDFNDVILHVDLDLGGGAESSNQLLSGWSRNDILTGGSGHDVIYGWHGQDLIRGGEGNDELYGLDPIYAATDWGKLDGDDTLSGGAGNDTLQGHAGNDHLSGDAGNDSLSGGLGTDILSGGADADVFVFNQVEDSIQIPGGISAQPGMPELGIDTITDFTQGQDQLDVHTFIQDFHQLNVQYIDTHTLITDTQSDFALKLVGEHHLTQADFIWA